MDLLLSIIALGVSLFVFWRAIRTPVYRDCTTCKYKVEDEFAPLWCSRYKGNATWARLGVCGAEARGWEREEKR